MDNAKFLTNIMNTFKYAYMTLEKKSLDYSGEEDPFKNFRLCESAGIVSAEEGILVRMFDKMGRVSNLIKQLQTPKVNESIEDTLMDLINYAAILIAYREAKNGSTK